MRLNKFLAQAGVASRRNSDAIIAEGRIFVNGRSVTQLGAQVDESRDRVEMDGKAISIIRDHVYLVLHKPVSYVVTCADNFGRPTVMDLVGKFKNIARPVGRLDYNSSGLLLLTNDGELAFRTTHPRYEISKTYQVKCEGMVDDEKITRLEGGLELESGKTAAAKIEILSRTENFSRLNISIHEGRKRQVRLMFQSVGHRVISLKRLRFGSLSLGDLKEGQFRHATREEIAALKHSVGL
jgi:pseudouridine synthase